MHRPFQTSAKAYNSYVLYDLYEYVESEPKAGSETLSGGVPQRQVSEVTRNIMSRPAAEIEVDRRHVLLQ